MRFFQMVLLLTGVFFAGQLSAQSSSCVPMSGCCKKMAAVEKTTDGASLAVAVALLPATNPVQLLSISTTSSKEVNAAAKPVNCDPAKCDRPNCDPSKCDPAKCDRPKCDPAACPKTL